MTAKGKGSNRTMLMIAGAVVVVVVVAALAFSEMSGSNEEAAQTAAVWTVSGPACPTPAPGEAASPPRGLEYEGVTFFRERNSGVNCNVIHPDGETVQVCMFLVPGALRVQTDKGSFDYAPAAGESASIYVRDGAPECVIGVNQALFALPGR